MSARRESLSLPEKVVATDQVPSSLADHLRGRQFSVTGENAPIVEADHGKLHRDLKGRHMQMIAIGGAIGAGLFVGTGGALVSGGPGSLVICFIIIGFMMFLMMQALCELAVMYPINGAFYTYICRFVDPSWGFAIGWDYGIQWLTILPFEISAACNIIRYWPGAQHINVAAWIAIFIVALSVISIFGVKGYGEVEFVLSMMKVLACTGFIILGVVIDCGGVSTDPRGYIGARYWHDPGAFANGFKGFCSVFVTASFAYGGTELTGLAAAEAQDPRKEIPKATKQVLWRVAFFYVVNLFIVGLIVPYNSPALLDNTGSESRHSPFVIAINLAGIKALPSVFNAVILISVISVANSCSFGSTRTFQALAANGMGPKLFAYVDNAGRPVATLILQILFGFLAFVNEAPSGGTIFNWLLALSGIANFFVYASICLAHIRFRAAWKLNGHSVDELPFRAAFGIWGSYLAVGLNFMCLAAQFYVALYPIGGSPDAEAFFEAYLAAPVLIFFYLIWKIYSWFYVPEHRPLYVPLNKIDVYAGLRQGQLEMISGQHLTEQERRESVVEIQQERKKGAGGYVKSVVGALF